MGYATGQFGKNHLGDLNQFLPTVHGFDEFFGYLYHLDAMEDPCHPNYPAALKATVGPRNMVHSWATSVDDPTVQPRWGKIGKQKIEDAGELCPKRMETVDDEILANALKFVDKARADRKPFFLWLNPTRMHVVTHLSPKYQAMRNSDNGWSEEEAGMAQLDDIVGSVMKYLKDNGLDQNTIVGFTTDNGTENFTWPDGGQTPFAGGKGTALEGGFRVPMILRWPGKVPAGKVENGIVSGLDWFPTFVAAAGNANIAEELKKGKQLGDRTYKVHLDGYNQMDLITGKGPSKRHEIFYFTESTLSAVRIDDYKYRFTDQPSGWLGATVKVDWPILVNLRLDPFERTGMFNGKDDGSISYLQLVRLRILALPVRAAGGGKSRADRNRVPSYAEGRELQSGGRQGADREGHPGAGRKVKTCCERAPRDRGAPDISKFLSMWVHRRDRQAGLKLAQGQGHDTNAIIAKTSSARSTREPSAVARCLRKHVVHAARRDIGEQLVLQVRSRFQPLSKCSFAPIRCCLLSRRRASGGGNFSVFWAAPRGRSRRAHSRRQCR